MRQPRRGPALAVLAAAAALFALFVAATGGIDTRIGGIPLRARSWDRPAILALVLAASAAALEWRVLLAALRHGLRRARPLVIRAAPLLVVAATVATALRFGTFAAGGADSAGYISQAALFARGRATDVMTLHPAFAWPDVPQTLTPLGYTTGHAPGVLAPLYPPGLPLLMAPFARIHAAAVFLVVPLLAGLTVWLTLLLGRRLGDPVAGYAGALLVAISPSFLLHSFQPMSDVPVTALWLAALLLAWRGGSRPSLAAGLVASLAILVRPNLAPLALLVAALCGVAPAALPQLRQSDRAAPPGAGAARALACLVALAPGLLLLALLQATRFGSPLSSGYGALGEMFALSNVPPNLLRYPRWLTEAHSPAIWLWVFAPLALRGEHRRERATGVVLWLFVLAVFAAYLPYIYFRPDEWSYIRFLLPALPPTAVLGLVVARRAGNRLSPRMGALALIAVWLIAAAWSARAAIDYGVFEFWRGEQKYPRVGAFARDHLPARAYVLAAQHSGSLRYYSGRATLRWDVLAPGALDGALTALRAAGFEPYAVLDEGEDQAFVERFRWAGQHGPAAMVPVVTIGNTTVYAFR